MGRKGRQWKAGKGSAGFSNTPVSRNDCGRYAFDDRPAAKSFARKRYPRAGRDERYVPYQCEHCKLYHLAPISAYNEHYKPKDETTVKVWLYACRNCQRSLEWIVNVGWVHDRESVCVVPYPGCEYRTCDHGDGPDESCECPCHVQEESLQ